MRKNVQENKILKKKKKIEEIVCLTLSTIKKSINSKKNRYKFQKITCYLRNLNISEIIFMQKKRQINILFRGHSNSEQGGRRGQAKTCCHAKLRANVGGEV